MTVQIALTILACVAAFAFVFWFFISDDQG